MKSKALPLLAGLVIFSFAGPVLAQSSSCTEIGKVASAQGIVRVQKPEQSQWSRVGRDSAICEGDTIQTGFRSRAAVNLDNDTVLRIKQSSTTTLSNFSAREEATSLLRLLSGVIHFFSRKPREYAIRTSTATIGVRGTEFVVAAAANHTDLTVFNGTVQAQNDVAPVSVSGYETVRIAGGQTMRVQTIARPRELVQWGLYYPPVLALDKDSNNTLRRAQVCARKGDFECAFDTMDEVPEGDRDATYLVYLASLQLAVGDTDAAALSLANAGSRNPSALALGAIMALVQNRAGEALERARQAVAIAPDSASALIAMSYVQQSRLELEAALETLGDAVAKNPDSALAWARLAEIRLALGRTGDARDAAARATALAPNLSRTQMVAGYAALSEMDTGAAIAAFDAALDLDSADPMAHLGLGLGRIRQGDLAGGRREIEAAVALDSNSAILRPYLGRAYFEEMRPPLDAEQYAIAKQLDPNDPTAYLFDALRLHAENRPVEAAAELRASIERNDNRAVYRGRNLLDQDRAARGASLARVFDTLGFTAQGISEATSSLNTDPANASAHRFLSDSYRQVRRREISRVSELLQAQMLQDINNNPVQPSVSSANLNLGIGAGDVGLNEFTGLFESNGVESAISILAGDNDTRGTEVVLSGTYNSLSVSLGGFDYESNGWRDNNAQDQKIGNLFVQWAATPRLNLQAEISSQDSAEGDLAFNFDPDIFDDSLKVDKELDSKRIGLRYSPAPNVDILVSRIETERTEQKVQASLLPLPNPAFPPVPPPVILVPGELEANRKDDGTQNELQYLHRFERFRLVAGLARAEVDFETVATTNPASLIPTDVSDGNLTQSRAYLYTTIDNDNGIELTLGASRDDYEEGSTDESDTNAKLGLAWRPDARQTLRLARLESTKPALVNNRTLEPTQVAGFNQFFDDANATRTSLSAIGYDIAVSSQFSVGVELSSRDMDEPIVTTVGPDTVTIFEDREESVSRLYLYWTPTSRIAVSAGLVSDVYEAESGIATQNDNLPEKVDTRSMPIGIKYFSPSGWFAGARVTRVDQEVTRDPGAAQASGDDRFQVVDLSLGMRLPKRLGSLSLEIQNAGDEQFMYQDDSFREFRDEPSTGPYFPERTAFIRANLVF